LRNLGILLLSLAFSSSIFGQETFTISGYVKDNSSGEELIGSTVLVKELATGSATNIYGFYSITIPKGTYTMVYSFIGYNSITKEINLESNMTINMELGSNSEVLQEVEIKAERSDENVESISMSKVDMNIETIKKIPALMGEVDLIRAIQLLPGVQTAGEGSTGFFVRGGGVDQNLILLDEATVFNASHLLGFFSVFNQDAIKDAQLYKGGIPARYGGRLSSVLDVHMKEGNSKRLGISGGIGLISSRLTVEAPIIKNKSSFIISGRRTYADLFLGLSPNESLKQSKLFFYDLNGKANYIINDKNRIYLSGYFGRDILGVSDAFLINWGNRTVTGRWNHLFSEKLFSNFTVIYSDFDYTLGIPEGVNAFEWLSRIQNYSLKNDYTYYPNTRNTLRFGWSSTFFKFTPADFKPLGDNEVLTATKFPDKNALDHALYLSNEQKLGSRFRVQYGLRTSIFQNIGTDTVYNFQKNEITGNYDTIPGNPYSAYGKNEIYNTNIGLEPRLGIKYTLDEFSSVKASYNRMFQYLHLANNSTSGTPLDIWFPTNTNIQPRRVDQVALGYFRNFKNNMFETSVEVYYKTVENSIDFKDNAFLIANRLLEGEVRIGSGEAYGAEFLVRKNEGKFTGWISYTLSRAWREIDEINNGDRYLANFDKTNNVSIVMSYDITDRVNLAATWVYSTGLPLTAPTGKFNYLGMTVPVYSDRNGARIPAYHRADFSCNYDLKKKEGKRLEQSLNFSVYNLYNRKNAFSIVFRQDEEDPDRTFAEKTYLFAIIPTITWNFKF
jgi:hypothetical protein